MNYKNIPFYWYLNFNFAIGDLKMPNKLLLLSPNRSVAQLVEQLTLNQRAQGSNPCRPTENEAITKHVIVSFCIYTFLIPAKFIKNKHNQMI